MKDIKNYTIEELKSLAYDLIRQREQVVNNLQAVNQLIVQKEKKDETKPSKQ